MRYVILSNSLLSHSNSSRERIIFVIDIISLINSSLFNVISFSLRIILIKIINSNNSISLVYKSLLYIAITFKTIKAIRYRCIKTIKETLISHY